METRRSMMAEQMATTRFYVLDLLYLACRNQYLRPEVSVSSSPYPRANCLLHLTIRGCREPVDNRFVHGRHRLGLRCANRGTIEQQRSRNRPLRKAPADPRRLSGADSVVEWRWPIAGSLGRFLTASQSGSDWKPPVAHAVTIAADLERTAESFTIQCLSSDIVIQVAHNYHSLPLHFEVFAHLEK